MMFILFFIVFSLGIILGAKVYKTMFEYNLKKENQKNIDDINMQFRQVLKNLKNGFTKFKSRVNSSVHIESHLNDLGPIDIIYLLDKPDILIFQGQKCLYTSDKVDKVILDNIILEIDVIYNKQISDVVNFFGFVFSRNQFQNQFGLDSLKIKDILENKINSEDTISDIDKIIDKNDAKFDVDEILDKISKYGISVLTPEEKKFLDNWGK